VPPNGPDANSAGAQLKHLKDALARTNEDLGVLRNQLEQKDAALDLLRRNYEGQVCVCVCVRVRASKLHLTFCVCMRAWMRLKAEADVVLVCVGGWLSCLLVVGRDVHYLHACSTCFTLRTYVQASVRRAPQIKIKKRWLAAFLQ